MSLQLDSMTDSMICAALNHLPLNEKGKVLTAAPAMMKTLSLPMVTKNLAANGWSVRPLEEVSRLECIEAMEHYRTVTDWSAYSEKDWCKAFSILTAPSDDHFA